MYVKYFLVLYFILICSIKLCAQTQSSPPLEMNITLTTQKLKVAEIIELLQRRNIEVSYSSSYINLQQDVFLKKKHMTIKELLYAFLDQDRVKCIGEKILLLPPKWRVISGFVRDYDSREALIGTIIYDSKNNVKGITNEYGYYSIVIPWEEPFILFSYIGYSPQKQIVGFDQKEILLKQSNVQLSEVVIYPKNKEEHLPASNVNMSIASYTPSILGVDDVIQRMQNFSGVSSQGILQPFNVRIDRADNNLILLDGMPVYHYLHLFSLYSIFNSQAIQKATLYKGLFPVKYEGRLSAVLDIRTKDGNKQRLGGAVSIDMLTLSALAEGPIKKNKSSFMFSVRRTWLETISMLQNDSEDGILKSSAFDIFMKFYVRLGYKNHLFISNYFGGDRFNLQREDDSASTFIKWNNLLANIRWNHVFNDKWFVNSSLSYSSLYNKATPYIFDINPDSRFQSQISDISLSSDIESRQTESFKLNFGYKLDFNDYISPIIYGGPDSAEKVATRDDKSLKSSVYLGVEYNINKKTTFIGGFNYINYFYRTNKTGMLQPRLQLAFKANPKLDFFSGVAVMGQFYHQITLPHVSIPYELRIPSSENIKPSKSVTYEIGAKGNITDQISFSSSLFYKQISNLLNYRVAQDIENGHVAPEPEKRVKQGDAKGFGLEIEAEYATTNWNVKSSYTYSKVKERYSKLEQSEYVLSNSDRPHLFNATVSWNTAGHSIFTGQFSAASGYLLSYPVYSLPSVDQVGEVSEGLNSDTYYYKKNNYKRFPASYRMDVGYTFSMKGFSVQSRFYLKAGIYNLIGDNNIFNFYPNVSDEQVKIHFMKLSNMIPYFGLTYSF